MISVTETAITDDCVWLAHFMPEYENGLGVCIAMDGDDDCNPSISVQLSLEEAEELCTSIKLAIDEGKNYLKGVSQ